MLLRGRDLWVRKYAQERPFPKSNTQGMWDEHYRYEIETDMEDVDPKTASATELLNNDFAKYRYAFERMDRTSDLFTAGISNLNLAVEHLKRLNVPTYVNVAKGTEIPHTLLMGPWNEEAIRFLFWLVMGGARIDWLTSTSGEVNFLQMIFTMKHLANDNLGCYNWVQERCQRM